MERRFTADRPNELWVTDLTYVPTWAGMVYVSFITDVFSRTIVGWRVASNMRTDMVLDWKTPAEALVEIGATASTGSVADSYDNALAETINGLYKTEVIRRRGPWRDVDAVELATLSWVHWFNTDRLHSSLGDRFSGPMRQWEFMYLQGSTLQMPKIMDEANKLGALGWEPVGIMSADKTLGLNAIVVIMKRAIEPGLPGPDSSDDWQADPSGRFDKRRWDPKLQVWTAETAMMEAKTLHVDPPTQ